MVQAARAVGSRAGSGLGFADFEEGFGIGRVGFVVGGEVLQAGDDDGGFLGPEFAAEEAGGDVAQGGIAIGARGGERVLARLRAASTNCGSLSVTSAWSGVFVRSRRTQLTSRLGALKVSMLGEGAMRFQKL